MLTTEDERGWLICETDQTQDAFLHLPLGDNIIARLAYQRCREAQQQGLPSQDYALLIADPAGASLSFCVCDGVGSSFQGGFSARYLAQRLVSWLSALPTLPRHVGPIKEQLGAELVSWSPACQAELLAAEAITETNALVREVLEELRDTYGSETVFFAGRIDRDDLPGDDLGERGARALLCWMGNVSAHIFASETQNFDIHSADDKNRWSSVHGPRGELTVWAFHLNSLQRIMLHTDGLDSLTKDLATLADDDLQARIRSLLEQPTNDDMTFLDVQWGADKLM